MQIRVTFRHTNPTEALKKYASEKVGRVSKLLIKPQSANIVLSVEKNRHRAEVLLHAIGQDVIKGVEESDDMYAAIDLVVDKLVRQAKKIKGKVKGKPTVKQVKARYRVVSSMPPISDAGDGTPEVTESQLMGAPAMGIDEAMAELRLSGRDFLVFTQRATDSVNIAYRRYDGFYGLIQPDLEGSANGAIPFRFEVYALDEDGEARKSHLMRGKDVSVESMTLEESLLQMEESRNDFWVFADEGRRYVNVVYRLPKHEYGLIEAFVAAS